MDQLVGRGDFFMEVTLIFSGARCVVSGKIYLGRLTIYGCELYVGRREIYMCNGTRILLIREYLSPRYITFDAEYLEMLHDIFKQI